MPTKRVEFATSVVNGKIYAIGGSVQPGWLRPDVEVYDPPRTPGNAKQICLMQELNLPRARLTGKFMFLLIL